ncbi:hypothetical protein CURE108131_06130 [Cupriavidus respiraculi]|uniref:Uncharacterized protein n=1 Tax=Cupriavidus respiraculi TaxID=195930 RepID=A0ABM8XBB8_9BURK|nr:hypothetical protein LMG21510_03267 [Cupriavidus respiraculi]
MHHHRENPIIGITLICLKQKTKNTKIGKVIVKSK